MNKIYKNLQIPLSCFIKEILRNTLHCIV